MQRYEVTPMIPPPGRKTGLLYRTDQPGDGSPFLRSAPGFRTIPKAEWKQWIEGGMNLSSQVWSVFDQNGAGSCAAESCNGGFKVIREIAGLKRVEFNPYAMYYTTSGGVDSGSTLQANLAHLRDRGAIPEAIWPRSKGWRAKPSNEAYEAAKLYRIDEFYEVTTWDEFASALLQNWVIYWGYSGHAIVGVDLLNEDQFLYLNSWGRWGQKSPYNKVVDYGFGVANRSQIMWGYGIYAFRTPLWSE